MAGCECYVGSGEDRNGLEMEVVVHCELHAAASDLLKVAKLAMLCISGHRDHEEPCWFNEMADAIAKAE